MTTTLTVLAVLVLTAAPATAGSSGDVGMHDVVARAGALSVVEQQRVLDYWTPRRMAAAVPAGLLGPSGRLARWLGAATGALAGSGVLGSVLAPRPGGGPEPGGGRKALAGRDGEQDGPGTGPETRREREARTTGSGPASGSAGRPAARSTGTRWPAGGAVTRTTGRVFLTMNGVDLVCSASTVRSANRDLVVTAGHCVKDGTGNWAQNWVFVPGYHEGDRPYGVFTARRMFVAAPWSRAADDTHDIGMVALNTSGGRHVADVVGTQEIAFGETGVTHAYGFGFPTDPPYDGERLVYCAGRLKPDPTPATPRAWAAT